MRGKAIVRTGSGAGRGITPAYAGKSAVLAGEIIISEDHPRVCGEKPPMGKRIALPVGSPPHVRGKVAPFAETALEFGITPACAGKSDAGQKQHCGGKDHPRMCGEKAASAVPFSPMAGSPPHVRGKGRSYMQVDGVPRITPACAGKSLKRGEFQTL